MKKKLLLALSTLISLAAVTPHNAKAISSKNIIISALVSFGAWGLYKVLRPATNKELCDTAQRTFEDIQYECAISPLIQNPSLLERPDNLFALAHYGDTSLLAYLPHKITRIKEQSKLLFDRIKKDRKKEKRDTRMNKMFSKLYAFEKTLEDTYTFLKTHESFFTVYMDLKKLSEYNSFIHKDHVTLRSMILGNAVSSNGDAHSFPFKSFATKLGYDLKRLSADIVQLKAHYQICDDNNANHYLNLISQAEAFEADLLHLRDAIAYMPEYVEDVRSSDQMIMKRRKLAAKERLARERLLAEQQAAHKKAEADKEIAREYARAQHKASQAKLRIAQLKMQHKNSK